jgi:hypothetical protein
MDRSLFSQTDQQSRSRRGTVRTAWRCLAMLLLLVTASGCTSWAVVGKMLIGDPTVRSDFRRKTGKSLEEGARVALVCTAPDSVLTEYDSVAIDVQEQLERLMARRGITMVDSDDVTFVLNRQGGQFNAQLIAQETDADYIMHIDIEFFDHRVPNSQLLYHGVAGGNIYGYEIVDGGDSGLGKRATRVFEQEFKSEYPGKHPIPADRTPERVFRNRFIDSLSAELGRKFYDFKTQEAF